MLEPYTIANFTNRVGWLRLGRRNHLCATDGAALWGASSYQSPYAVWWSKCGPFEENDADIVQRVGHALEPLVAALFTESTNIEVRDPGDFALHVSREFPFLACTPDRISADSSAVVELKTAHFSAADEWKTRIPLAYQIQLQHQMIVLGVDRAFIAVLINSTTFKHHEMRLSPDFKRRHVAKCKTFWERYVEANEAPPTDYSEATSRALAKQWAASRPVAVDLPAECDGLGERFDRLQKLSGKLDRRQNEIKNRIKSALAGNELGRLPDGSGFSWSGKNGTRRFTRKAKIHGDE